MSPALGAEGRLLVDRFRRARRDPELVLVEGFHAIKHALRFDADLIVVICCEPLSLQALAAELAPDVALRLEATAQPVSEAVFAEISPRAPRTGVAALARRPSHDLASLLADPRPAPIVLLEEPRDLNNVGACVRVAAAAEAAGVLVTGRHDPWHADAVRGAAGLHFALPVLWSPQLPFDEMPLPAATGGQPPAPDRPLVALDPAGATLSPEQLPPRATLAFGSERRGLSRELLAAADATVRIPMRESVSSLNLATSVAAVLFTMRLCG